MVLLASRGIGNAGTMEIHDLDGTNVLMRIRSSDSSTFDGAVPIRVYVGGGWSGWFTVSYPSGSPWVDVWYGAVTVSQSVAFAVGDTDTWGFGAGGELWASVGRATVPPAPSNVPGTPALITRTGMVYQFNSSGDGGSGIIRWEYQCSTRADFAGAGWASNGFSGTVTRNDLTPDTVYFWRSRGVNGVGAGYPSATVSARTLPAGFLGGKGGSFVPFPTTVGKGSAFVDTQIFIGKGGAFVPLG